MTTPTSYPDPSSFSGSGDQRARQATGGLRELAALVLLGANAVFQLIGVFAVFIVVDDWAADFGFRSEVNFPRFAGVLPVVLPLLAVLLATHVAPVVGKARLITITALAEYGVSGFFGLIAFIGRVAFRLDRTAGLRSAFDGLFDGMVWLALVAFAAYVVYRVWQALFYVPRPQFAGYPPATYGQPYPGQPTYPAQGGPVSGAGGYPPPGFQSGYPTVPGVPAISSLTSLPPQAVSGPTGAIPIPTGYGPEPSYPTSGAGGWPSVPPPPMPAPPLVPGSPVHPVTPAVPPPAPRSGPPAVAPNGPAPVPPTGPAGSLSEPTVSLNVPLPVSPSGPPPVSPSGPPPVPPSGPPAVSPNGPPLVSPNGPPPVNNENEPTRYILPPQDPPTQPLR